MRIAKAVSLSIFILAYLLFILNPQNIAMEVKADSVFSGGQGTSSDPYIVGTPDQLNAIRNNLSDYYRIGNNIDLTLSMQQGGAYYNAGAGWAPIGTQAQPFTGSLDGNGYKIIGLYVNQPNGSQAGLFGYMEGAVVNLNINQCNITGGQYIGAIAAITGDTYHRSGTITNCSVSGNISGSNVGTVCAGGITGTVYGFISGCKNYASMDFVANFDNNSINAGGISRGIGINSFITSCSNSGAISVVTSRAVTIQVGGIFSRVRRQHWQMF